MDEAVPEFKDKFNNQLILDAQRLEEAVYQLDNQLQNTPEEVAPLITKKRSKHKKHGMTNNSMTKGKYSKIEKANASNIKHRTSGSYARGREIDTVQCSSLKRDTHCSHRLKKTQKMQKSYTNW